METRRVSSFSNPYAVKSFIPRNIFKLSTHHYLRVYLARALDPLAKSRLDLLTRYGLEFFLRMCINRGRIWRSGSKWWRIGAFSLSQFFELSRILRFFDLRQLDSIDSNSTTDLPSSLAVSLYCSPQGSFFPSCCLQPRGERCRDPAKALDESPIEIGKA